jgi:hypothetical protein
MFRTRAPNTSHFKLLHDQFRHFRVPFSQLTVVKEIGQKMCPEPFL